jgi:hypothetical protein
MDGTTALGWSWSKGKREWQLARIADEDRRQHLYVLGATGSGKTKFLEFLIRQDLVAGRGVGVIDPHGDLIEALKGALAAVARTRGTAFLREEVVLVDPADPLTSVSFNPIESHPGTDPGEQVAELIASFRKIWADSWGVRMEDLLRNSLLALSAARLSLVELPAFLTDATFRAVVLRQLTHPIARAYFDRFARLSDRAQLTWSEPVLNKINALLAHDRVRQLLAAPASTFDLRQVMDRGQVLLIKLDKGRLKDGADLLGSLLLAKLQLAAFSRSNLPVDRRRPFTLYVDEFQNFATASFGILLSEARKYGLSLVLAHQTLAQIPEELQSLILGNTGIQVAFRVNRRDAERLAKEAFTYSGYAVKSATLQRINYWSLGEEWERYTAAVQNQPPRTAWVKHKIAGGLIPIQTADVPLPWEELGIPRDRYDGYLAALPIGAAYLRPRTALDGSATRAPGPGPDLNVPAPPVPSVLPESSHTPTALTAATLSEEEERFLRTVVEAPPTPVSELYQRFGASIWKGAELRRVLIERGWLLELETRLGKGGRAAKFLLPTFATLDRFGLVPPGGRGGPLHRHVQEFVVAEATARGYAAQIEHPLPDGSVVDVHVDRGGATTAVEIAIASRRTRELDHVTAALAAGYDRVVCLVLADALRADLTATLPTYLAAADVARVTVAPLTQLGRLF